MWVGRVSARWFFCCSHLGSVRWLHSPGGSAGARISKTASGLYLGNHSFQQCTRATHMVAGWLPRERKQKLPVLLRHELTFYWSKQVTRPAQIQGQRKLMPTLKVGGNPHVWGGARWLEPPLETVYHVKSPEIKFRKRNSHQKRTTTVIHQGHVGVRILRNSYYLPLEVKLHRGRKVCVYLFIWVSS